MLGVVFSTQSIFADRYNSFQQNFLYPIEDIGFLISNLKRYLASDYFFLISGGWKIAKLAMIWTELSALLRIYSFF